MKIENKFNILKKIVLVSFLIFAAFLFFCCKNDDSYEKNGTSKNLFVFDEGALYETNVINPSEIKIDTSAKYNGMYVFYAKVGTVYNVIADEKNNENDWQYTGEGEYTETKTTKAVTSTSLSKQMSSLEEKLKYDSKIASKTVGGSAGISVKTKDGEYGASGSGGNTYYYYSDSTTTSTGSGSTSTGTETYTKEEKITVSLGPKDSAGHYKLCQLVNCDVFLCVFAPEKAGGGLSDKDKWEYTFVPIAKKPILTALVYSKDGFNDTKINMEKFDSLKDKVETLLEGIAEETLQTIEDVYPIGSGSEEDPRLILFPADFLDIANCPDGHFKLLNDIDLKDVDFKPIGKFSGVLDGNGKTIKNLNTNLIDTLIGTVKNLTVDGCGNTMNVSNSSNIGSIITFGVIALWCGDSMNNGYIESVTVQNLKMEITHEHTVEKIFCGGIVGQLCKESYIKDSKISSGSLNLIFKQLQQYVILCCYVGGIAGQSTDSACIENCTREDDFTINVKGMGIIAFSGPYHCYIAGIAGEASSKYVKNCKSSSGKTGLTYEGSIDTLDVVKIEQFCNDILQ